MASDPRKVLISYSHDSPEHEQRVLTLADRLRAQGIDCMIDQYVLVPEEGWPLWMERQIRDSNFVLMVCTETYLKRVLGEEQPGKGLGVRWEGNSIYNAIYNAGVMNTKFIPLLFWVGDASHIPMPLKGVPFYEPLTDAGYEDLYRRLTNRVGQTAQFAACRTQIRRRIRLGWPKSDAFKSSEPQPVLYWPGTGVGATAGSADCTGSGCA